jgi:L-lactate dehydrogenase complex protein LldE
VRVALFITCVADTLFPQTGRATVELLERLGHEVTFPEEQTCCGQMHANAGYREQAEPLMRRFVEIFAAADAEAIVAPSASCLATVRHSYPQLAREAGDEALVAAVDALAGRCYELSQFLVAVLGLEDVGAYYPHRVAYHPTCHSLRELGVGDAPLRLLRAVRGLDLVELQRAETCCGFGGTFAIKNAEVSTAMLGQKLRDVVASGAEVCAAADRSCLMHIGGGLSRARAPVRTVHLAEILASADTGAPV